MKRSLTLCASILLLAPLSLAMSFQDSGFSVSLGNRAVTIGDRTGTTLNLLGDGKGAGALGTTIALAHSTPTAIVEASTLYPFGEKGHAVKLSLEAQVSSSSKHKLYDGVSKTGTVTMDAYGAVIDSGSTTFSAGSDYDGGFGIIAITGGTRAATVEHQAAFGGKILYAFGEDNHNIGIGLGLLWTNDDYKYTVQENPTAAADSGVFDQTTPVEANLFDNPAMKSNASPAIGVANRQGSTTTVGYTYTPTLGTEAKYDDRMMWYGAAIEGNSNISDCISLRSGLSYYKRSFEISKDFVTAAPFVVTAADATMYIGHVGISYKRDAS